MVFYLSKEELQKFQEYVNQIEKIAWSSIENAKQEFSKARIMLARFESDKYCTIHPDYFSKMGEIPVHLNAAQLTLEATQANLNKIAEIAKRSFAGRISRDQNLIFYAQSAIACVGYIQKEILEEF